MITHQIVDPVPYCRIQFFDGGLLQALGTYNRGNSVRWDRP